MDQVFRITLPDYQEYAPGELAKAFVHCFWTFTGPASQTSQTIVPDGRPELIFHLACTYSESKDGSRQPRVVFAGQLTRPLVLNATGPISILGARFRPDGARHFLGGSLVEATNRRLDLQERHEPQVDNLLSSLRSSGDELRRITVLEEYILRVIGANRPDMLVRDAVDLLMEGKELDLPDGVGVRQFQRRFRREVGISPRKIRSIRRFRSVFDRLAQEKNESWVQRALETGYFDQPQLARDFNQYVACSPKEWLRKSGKLETALAGSRG